MLTLEMRGGGAVMWNRIWQFLQEEKNQRMLTLIGGGLLLAIARIGDEAEQFAAFEAARAAL